MQVQGEVKGLVSVL